MELKKFYKKITEFYRKINEEGTRLIEDVLDGVSDEPKSFSHARALDELVGRELLEAVNKADISGTCDDKITIQTPQGETIFYRIGSPAYMHDVYNSK